MFGYHAVQSPPRRWSYVCLYYLCVYVYICIFVWVSVCVYVCVCVFSLPWFGEIK